MQRSMCSLQLSDLIGARSIGNSRGRTSDEIDIGRPLAPLQSSPAIRWSTRARPRANVVAKWGMNRRTAATTGVGDRVIDRPMMNMTDGMIFGRSRCRERGAENNCSGKRDFYLAKHCRISCLSRCGSAPNRRERPHAKGDCKTQRFVPESQIDLMCIAKLLESGRVDQPAG